MLPRATVTQRSALEPLFDLEPEERAGVPYVVPSPNNVVFPVTSGMIVNPRPTHWKHEHTEYLDELVELAARDVENEPYKSTRNEEARNEDLGAKRPASSKYNEDP